MGIETYDPTDLTEAEARAILDAAGIPPIAGGDGEGDGDGNGSGDGDTGGSDADADADADASADSDADDADADADDDDADDADGDGPTRAEHEALQRRLREAESQRRKLERKEKERQQKQRREAGEFEQLYETEKQRSDRLEKDIEELKLTHTVTAVARRMDYRSPEVAMRLVSLPDGTEPDDEKAVEKALKALARKEPYLVDKKRPQSGSAGAGEGDKSGNGTAEVDENDPRALIRAGYEQSG